MSKPLNLNDAERVGVRVTFNLNRYEVFAAAGWFMSSAADKAALKAFLALNGIRGALFDGVAQRMYLAGR